MKIYIKGANSNIITIPFPLGILEFGLYNGNMMTLLAKKHMDEKAFKYLECIDFHLLAKHFNMLKKYKGLTIVEVKTSDGEEISIVI